MKKSLFSAQHINDVNAISNYISKLYALIGQRAGSRLNISTGWLSLFCSSSLRVRRVLNDEIKSLGISISHWKQLQELRRERNALMHPVKNCDEILNIVNTRWNNHRAFAAVKSMLHILQNNRHLARRTYVSDEGQACGLRIGASSLQTDWRGHRRSSLVTDPEGEPRTTRFSAVDPAGIVPAAVAPSVAAVKAVKAQEGPAMPSPANRSAQTGGPAGCSSFSSASRSFEFGERLHLERSLSVDSGLMRQSRESSRLYCRTGLRARRRKY